MDIDKIMPKKKTKHVIKEIGNKWTHGGKSVASSYGEGSDKDLSVTVRWDGFGNSVVRFIVKNHGEEISYEKYDAAVGAYNLLP